MRKTVNQAWLVTAVGTFAFAVAIVEFAGLQIGVTNGWPFNQGNATAMVGVALIAVATSTIAHVLTKIEARLTALERADKEPKS